MRNFTWHRFPIKNLLIDSLLIPIVESTCLNRDMCKFESSQKDESRWQSTDSSKAYRNTSAFKCPLTFVTFCPVFGLRPNLSTGMFIILPKIINYFLQPFSFLHLFQNKKTKMATNNFFPWLNLLSWIEDIAEIVVQLSWWGQSEWVKVKFIVSTFEPYDPVRPISISVV